MIYRRLFYVNIHGSYILSRNNLFFGPPGRCTSVTKCTHSWVVGLQVIGNRVFNPAGVKKFYPHGDIYNHTPLQQSYSLRLLMFEVWQFNSNSTVSQIFDG